MIIVTTEQIPGYEIKEVKGIVHGDAFIGTGFWTSICLGFENFFGACSKRYAKKMSLARDEAKDQLIKDAKSKRANAIIGYIETHTGNRVGCVGTAVRIMSTNTLIECETSNIVESSEPKQPDIKPEKKPIKEKIILKEGDEIVITSCENYASQGLSNGSVGHVRIAGTSISLVEFIFDDGVKHLIKVFHEDLLKK